MSTEEVIIALTFATLIIIWIYSRKEVKELKNQMWISVYSDYTRRYSDIISKFPEDINNENFSLEVGTNKYNEVMRAMRLYFGCCPKFRGQL